MDQQDQIKHICRSAVITINPNSYQGINASENLIQSAVERAYTQLKERAKEQKSVLVGVTQTISTESAGGVMITYIVTLVGSIVSIEEVERQRRMQQFTGVNGLRTN